MTNLVVRSTGSAPAAAASSIALRRQAGRVCSGRDVPCREAAGADSGFAQSAGARRVASVQRALTEYGYGQLKPTGAVGSDTQAAITKFERDRKLPVTGQMSDRLVKELTAMTGRPIE